MKYFPDNKEDLKKLCNDQSVKLGEIDTSRITDMSGVFDRECGRKDFSGIENWNVSRVTNMSDLFRYLDFNGDISKWDVSNVKNMSHMFGGSSFNGDISNWDVSKVTDMFCMFRHRLLISPLN